MKNIKRWLALFLAVLLLASNAVYSMSSSLKANQLEGTQDNLVQEEPAQTEPDTTNMENMTAQVVEETKQPDTQVASEPVNDPSGSVLQEQTTPETSVPQEEIPQEVKYNVIINRPEVEGGSVQVWSAEDRTAVEYNENGQFTKEITEGAPFYLEVTAGENYEVEQVLDQNSNPIALTGVNEKVYTYNIPSVTNETILSIIYKEVKQETADADTNSEEVKPQLLSQLPTQQESATFEYKVNDPEGGKLLFEDGVKEEIQNNGEAAPKGNYVVIEKGWKFLGWKNNAGETVTKDIRILPQPNEYGVYESDIYTAYIERPSSAKIQYKISNPAGGTLTNREETVVNNGSQPQGTKVNLNKGWRIISWTDSSGKRVSGGESFIPPQIQGQKDENGVYQDALYIDETYTVEVAESHTHRVNYYHRNSALGAGATKEYAFYYGVDVQCGATHTLIQEQLRYGFIFTGWTWAEGGQPINATTVQMPHGNIKIYGDYKVDESIKFRFIVEHKAPGAQDNADLQAQLSDNYISKTKTPGDIISAKPLTIEGYKFGSIEVIAYGGETAAHNQKTGVVKEQGIVSNLRIVYTYVPDETQGKTYQIKHVKKDEAGNIIDTKEDTAEKVAAEQEITAAPEQDWLNNGYKVVSKKVEPSSAGHFEESNKFVGKMPNQQGVVVEYTYAPEQVKTHKYTVKHLGANGTVLDTTTSDVAEGKEITAVPKEFKGYQYQEASVEPADSGKFDADTKAFKGKMPKDDVTVVYKYQSDNKTKFLLTVEHVREGELPEYQPEPKEYLVGADISAQPNKYIGYVLDSVEIDKTGVGEFNKDDNSFEGKMPNTPVKITYNYTKDPKHQFSFKVRYVDTNGKEISLTDESFHVSSKDAWISASPKTIDGYQIKNGVVKPGYLGTGFVEGMKFVGMMPSEDVVVTYVYNTESKIRFETNGGTPKPADIEGVEGESTGNRSLPGVTKTGHQFEGWYENSKFSGDEVTSLPTTFPKGETIYYAKWKPLEYKVIGKINLGTVNGEQKEVTQKVTYNQSSKEMEFKASAGNVIRSIRITKDGQTSVIEGEKGQMSYVYKAVDKVTSDITVEVTTGPGTPAISVTKKIKGTPENKTAYVLGETVEFEVTVENTGEIVLKDIEVVDALEKAVIENGTGNKATIDTLEVGDKETFKVTYTIKESDLGKEFKNVVTATAKDGTKGSGESEPVKTMPLSPGHTITKTITNQPGENGFYKPGDEISYEIKVKNTGNTTLKNVTVKDTTDGSGAIKDVNGAEWSAAEKTFTIGTMKPDATTTITYKYVVDKKDAGMQIKNTAAVFIGEEPGKTDTVTSPKVEQKKLNVTKEIIGKPETGSTYALGETVNFTVIVKNTGNVPLTEIVVEDQLKGAELAEGQSAAIAELAVNESKEIKYVYKVQEDDIKNAAEKPLVNIAVATAKDGTTDKGTSDEVPLEGVNRDYNIVKTVESNGTGADGKYKVGERVKYQIVVQNTGNETLKNLVIKDEMTDASGKISNISATAKWNETEKTFTIAEVAPKKSTTITYEYEVLKEDAGKTIANVASTEDSKTTKPDQPVVVEKKGLKVTKEIDDYVAGKTYRLGDTVNFTVTVKNTGNVTLNNIKLVDELDGAVLQNGQTDTIAVLEPNGTDARKYSYTIQEADLGKTFNNVVVATADDDTTGKGTSPDITVENPNANYDISKAIISQPESNGVYKPGDTIRYQIIVTNKGNTTLSNVTVKDNLRNASGEISNVTGAAWDKETGTFTIGDILPSAQPVTITYDYVVQEKDAGAKLQNTAIFFEDGEEGGSASTDPVEIEKKGLKLTKTINNAPEEGRFALGDVVEFTVTVKNTGNVTLNNIQITDQLEGAVLTAGEAVIEELPAGDSRELTYTYTIQEKDLGTTFKNIATATAEDGTTGEGETPNIPVEDKNPAYSVEKSFTGPIQDNDTYAVGSTINYTINVANTGNTTLEEVIVQDIMTGASGAISNVQGADWNEATKTFTVAEIQSGETATITYDYVIQQKDAGKTITNVAIGKDNQSTPENPVVVEKKGLKLTKTISNAPEEEGTFAIGDVVEFTVTVKNTGNVTLNNIQVADQLEGAVLTAGEAVIAELTAGASTELTYTYTIQEKDLGTLFKNIAIATADDGTTGEGETPNIPVADKNDKLDVQKTVLNKQESYAVGDTIRYQVVVSNAGNQTLSDVLVTDLLSNAAGSISNIQVDGAAAELPYTIATLAPNASVTMTYEYVVQSEDRGQTIKNTATAAAGDISDSDTTPGEKVEALYNIAVNHVYAEGEAGTEALPEDYVIEEKEPGFKDTLTAGTVSGYTAYPSEEKVEVKNKDISVTFIYYADVIGTEPGNPDAGDGIPDRYQAVITYQAVNGTVTPNRAVVTLLDATGKPSETGVGHLRLAQLGRATANSGYDQNSLTWDTQPSVALDITGDMTFTAQFSLADTTTNGGTTPTAPTTPTPATPTPTTPAAVTPTTVIATITEPLTALADTIGEAINANVEELVAVDEDGVPLANKASTDHKCCILHVLLMMLALVLEISYTKNAKKRQQRIFELREEIALLEKEEREAKQVKEETA